MNSLIIHFGPSDERRGGIRTVMEDIVGSPLLKEFSFTIVPTAAWKKRVSVFIKGYAKARKLARKREGVIFHVHMSENASCYRSAMLVSLARKMGARSVLHSHGGEFISFLERTPGICKRILVAQFKKADTVVALTPGWKEFWSTLVDEDVICVIPNCVHVPPFRDGAKGELFTLAYLGHMSEIKGAFDLIEAGLILKEQGYADSIRIVMAGDGELQRCQSIISECGLDEMIEVRGWIAGTEKDEFLYSSDALVLPSHYESFGIVAIEALAHGIPVICSDGGFICDTVREGVDSFVFSVGQPKELAECIRHCCSIRDELPKYGRRGYERVKGLYSKDVVMETWRGLYEDLLRREE